MPLLTIITDADGANFQEVKPSTITSQGIFTAEQIREDRSNRDLVGKVASAAKTIANGFDYILKEETASLSAEERKQSVEIQSEILRGISSPLERVSNGDAFTRSFGGKFALEKDIPPLTAQEVRDNVNKLISAVKSNSTYLRKLKAPITELENYEQNEKLWQWLQKHEQRSVAHAGRQ